MAEKDIPTRTRRQQDCYLACKKHLHSQTAHNQCLYDCQLGAGPPSAVIMTETEYEAPLRVVRGRRAGRTMSNYHGAPIATNAMNLGVTPPAPEKRDPIDPLRVKTETDKKKGIERAIEVRKANLERIQSKMENKKKVKKNLEKRRSDLQEFIATHTSNSSYNGDSTLQNQIVSAKQEVAYLNGRIDDLQRAIEGLMQSYAEEKSILESLRTGEILPEDEGTPAAIAAPSIDAVKKKEDKKDVMQWAKDNPLVIVIVVLFLILISRK